MQPGILRGQKVERAMLQRAKELRRQMTEAEDRVWQQLRRAQLVGPHFRWQQGIHKYIAIYTAMPVGWS